jgi:dephospho-CoA kinase
MTRPFLLGLTGSIGMGKSTTAGFFAAAGVPVWDADAAVHRLYASGGAAVGPVAAAFPAARGADGSVLRAALKAEIGRDPAALGRIEAIVHPMLRDDRLAFIAAVQTDVAVLDLPLLFETGAESWVNATLVVTAPPELQRARVLARPGMTAEQFDLLLARQLPDRDKRARATHIIETLGMEAVRHAVDALIAYIRSRHA